MEYLSDPFIRWNLRLWIYNIDIVILVVSRASKFSLINYMARIKKL